MPMRKPITSGPDPPLPTDFDPLLLVVASPAGESTVFDLRSSERLALADAGFWLFGFPLPEAPTTVPGADDFDEADNLGVVGIARRGDIWASLVSLFCSVAPVD